MKRNNLKYWFYLFAILDLLSLKNFIFRFDFIIADKSFFRYIIIFLYLTFIASAYLLFEKKKLGLIINFIQFPIRLFLMILSFDFIGVFAEKIEISIKNFYFLIIGLEILRLISEIIFYRKLTTIINIQKHKTW